jgi:hypothetical protein
MKSRNALLRAPLATLVLLGGLAAFPSAFADLPVNAPPFLGYRYARLYPGKLRALLLDAAIDRSVTASRPRG